MHFASLPPFLKALLCYLPRELVQYGIRLQTDIIVSSFNFALCEEPSSDLKMGDMISCRGFGRFKITGIEGRTKKGKIRLAISQIKRK